MILHYQNIPGPMPICDFSSVQLLSLVWPFVTPCTAAHKASLSITNSQSLLKLILIKLLMPSNHLILCHPFSSCFQSFPASGSFPMSQFFASGGQSIGVLESASVLPMNIQDWFLLGWTGWISLKSKGLSRVLSNARFQGINYSALSFLHSPTLTSIHDHWKNHSFDWTNLSWSSWQKKYLLFNMLSRLVLAFLPKSKRLLISWLQSPSAVIFEPKKVCHCFHCLPIFGHEVMGPDAMILVLWMLSFKPTFSFSSFTFIKRLFSSFSLSAIRVMSSAYLRLLMFLPAILIPACASSSLAFHMIYSAYNLNKQCGNI